MPSTFSISAAEGSGSAAGRSILLRAATISRSCSSAWYELARVWASIPGGVDQQDDARRRPATATPAEVDMARRADEVDHVVAIPEPTDWSLMAMRSPLELHGVQVLVAHVPRIDGTAELQEAVGQRGLAVVDVGDDRDVVDARAVL